MKKIVIVLLLIISFIQISCSSDIENNTTTANPVDVYVVGKKNSNAAYWKNNQEVLLNNGIGCEADMLMVSNGNIHVFGKKQLDNWTTQFMYWKNNVATNLTETFNTPAQFVRSITGMDVVGEDVYFVGYTKNPLIAAEIYDFVYWKNGNKTVIDGATNPTFKSKIKVVNNIVYVIGNKSNCFNNCHGVFVNGVFQAVPVGVLLNGITVKDNQVYVYGKNNNSTSVYLKNLTTGTESNIPSISNAIKLLFDNDNLYNCELCGFKNRAFTTRLLWRTPKILIIHIKRFLVDNFGNRTKKLINNVKYPIYDLDISKYICDDSDYKSKSKYNKFRKHGIEIFFMKNYFEQLGVDITKEEYYTLFKDIGQIIDGKIDITNATRK